MSKHNAPAALPGPLAERYAAELINALDETVPCASERHIGIRNLLILNIMRAACSEAKSAALEDALAHLAGFDMTDEEPEPLIGANGERLAGKFKVTSKGLSFSSD